jgi:hypothetical protein
MFSPYLSVAGPTQKAMAAGLCWGGTAITLSRFGRTVRLVLWFLYTKRGIRIELPTAISVQEEALSTLFLDENGCVVARVDRENVWLHADHALDEDYEPTDSDD